jgi:HPt (histidine-containing phosphotransfer) domain-containing protein
MSGILDGTSLAMLREAQEPGAPDIVEETVAIFLADAERRIALLRFAVAARDGTEVRRLAHTIRGACLVLGVRRLGHACGVLEQLGVAGPLADAPEALRQVEEEYRAAHDALRAAAGRPAAQ